MSEIDKLHAEREAARTEKERARKERFDVAMSFLRGLYEHDVKPSKVLVEREIDAQLDDNRLLLHRRNAGIYADAFQIAVGPDGEIDIGGRSLGQYHPDHKVRLRREIITEMLTYFDL
jgi:hypothetical protein